MDWSVTPIYLSGDRLSQIFRLEQPLLFGYRAVNIYVLPGPPPVLIDSGLLMPDGVAELRQALHAVDVELEDVAHVFLTHAHMDHAGMVMAVRKVSGAEIWAHPGETCRLDGGQYRFFTQFLPILLDRFGVPLEKSREFMTAIRRPALGYHYQTVDNFNPLYPGQKLPLTGLNLEVIFTPGHSQGSVCFLDHGRRVLFSGDTVSPWGPPRPLLAPAGEREITFDGLRSLEDSLVRLSSLDAEVVLPGHGPAAGYRDNLRSAQAALAALRPVMKAKLQPGATVYDLVDRLDPTQVTSTLLYLGETRSLLEAMKQDGMVTLELDGMVERFYPTTYQT